MHQEIPVKVNAWVDEGVAPLVRALNRFSFLRTLDSCEGVQGADAYCYFGHIGSAADLDSFVARLQKELGAEARLKRTTGTQHPMAVIFVPPDRLRRLAVHLGRLATNDRSYPSAGGNVIRGDTPPAH